MDEIDKDIVRDVDESNKAGIEIYPKKMFPMYEKRTSKTTFYKRINNLIVNGELETRSAEGEYNVRKPLYIPTQKKQTVRDMITEMHSSINTLVTFFGSFQKTENRDIHNKTRGR